MLTYKYACDVAVVSLMESSSHALKNNILELHSEHWMKCHLQYLADCERHQAKLSLLGMQLVEYLDCDPIRDILLSQWFIATYVRDSWSRLDSCKALITFVFRDILKIDSTKKTLSKLAGDSSKSATWVTNVGN